MTRIKLVLQRLPGRSAVRVQRIEVAQEYRGMGLGSSVMGSLCSWAEERYVTLLLTPDPVSLRPWYMSFGFVHNTTSEFLDDMIRLPQLAGLHEMVAGDMSLDAADIEIR